MQSPLSFCLVGGDARQLSLGTLLKKNGYPVYDTLLSKAPFDPSCLTKADCILLPMPLMEAEGTLYAPLCSVPPPIPHILDILSPKQLIFGGKISPAVHAQSAERGLILHDYLLRKELAIANAVPTAEGALQLAMERLPITIHGARVLIAGFGRVGQCTAQRFRALGADVTVCARSPAQLALAESSGCHIIPLSELTHTRQSWDLLINTIPALIFTSERLRRLNPALLLELASSPGGFDLDAVHNLALNLIPAPGLPGKVAPVTAAKNIQKTIFRMLEELDF